MLCSSLSHLPTAPAWDPGWERQTQVQGLVPGSYSSPFTLVPDHGSLQDKVQLLRLWYHENCRVFRDRLVNEEDRSWFDQLLKSHMEQWDVAFDEVCIFQPILYGDFMSPGSDVKSYELITNEKKVSGFRLVS